MDEKLSKLPIKDSLTIMIAIIISMGVAGAALTLDIATVPRP